MKNVIILTITAFAALTSALPNNVNVFPHACPTLKDIAQDYGCKVSDKADCEICCPPKVKINPGKCHGGHDKPDPCKDGWKQWHCEKHIAERRA